MATMQDVFTTYEAALQLKVTAGYVRRLMQDKRIKGRLAPVSKHRSIWLVDKRSLKTFQANLKK